MKIFMFVLILGLCKIMTVRSGCEDLKVRLELAPQCGVRPDCYLSAANDDAIVFASCVRKERGLPDFESIREGVCPTDKPICTYDSYS